ncbi:Predicted O-linked N-acetylglucosamine transferase, SPINDLY family [Anaerobiospirillum thomasii]|uniref:suppressor of fused domain protein n=1 Tax=Anaerobiospirillum thomasii TaxID=179995 RepID=UPI000D86ECA0|nr:suppressor of fused domain protein [Anaerobiospirillum thomasii]SPT71347.1 Predicted O-linked N-acetylglucosamine transferase, SPINDLY family [Anaerobiospirillum thomasii]
MNIIEQCQQYKAQGNIEKIIEILEALAPEERTAELDFDLACAYISIAPFGDEGRPMLIKACNLLLEHEEYFADEPRFLNSMATANLMLENIPVALEYYKKALALQPDDENIKQYIEDCKQRLSMPIFSRDFFQRTQKAWEEFVKIEGRLREIIDSKDRNERGNEMLELCATALKTALDDISFELGFNGSKYELVLSAHSLRHKLFILQYFLNHAPQSLFENWNIVVGRQRNDNFLLRTEDFEINADDVLMWVEKNDDNRVKLTLYCHELLPVLKKDRNHAFWAMCMLIEQCIGEISTIAHIASFDIADKVKDSMGLPLNRLPGVLESMGCEPYTDAKILLDNSFYSYSIEPVKDPEAPLRFDIFAGSTSLTALLNDYYSHETDIFDEYYCKGIVAGFICFSLESFVSDDRAKEILNFRDKLLDTIVQETGDDAFIFIGGATGLYYCYIDFIACDLTAVLETAEAFFAQNKVESALFKTLRYGSESLSLIDDTIEPVIHEDTSSVLSSEDIKTLESFVDEDDDSGYYGKMMQYLDDFIDKGIEDRLFSKEQAQEDLQLALWYAYAGNNLDSYMLYYSVAQWMEHSYVNARGCGTWFYRYSVALMYCSRLDEALKFAKEGAVEEPDYPWIWLQLGKLLYHFGDKEGALDAVEHGLKLVPGDYEFETLKQEIDDGASLEQMEYHWINPNADKKLQMGLDEDADDKQRAIACIRVNEEGLAKALDLFKLDGVVYKKDIPGCEFKYVIEGQEVVLVFRMNEAGLSKMSYDRLYDLQEKLLDGSWLKYSKDALTVGTLSYVLVEQNYDICLVYSPKDVMQSFRVIIHADGTQSEPFGLVMNDEGVETYSQEEMAQIEEHISKTFGDFEKVMHELISPDIHVDICVVPPSDRRNYYTLITMGMGAHRMNVPEELASYNLERAELAIALPPDWKLDDASLHDEKWYWPVRLLKSMARLPIYSETWLGFGHSLDNEKPFADNTQLCAAMLTGLEDTLDDGEICILSDDLEINFYQVIPLYREEMEYKMTHDADSLLEKMAGISFIVDPYRKNAIEKSTKEKKADRQYSC